METEENWTYYDDEESEWYILRDAPHEHFKKSDIPILPEIASALLIAGNILVIIFAFCGNCAAIIVCLRSKFTRSATRWFLISLAVSDLLYSSFGIVRAVTLILDKFHSWNLGEFMCTITDFMTTFTLITNCSCLIAIAVDRYLAVVRGLKPPCMSPRMSNLLSYVSLSLVWIVPIGCAAPLLTHWTHIPFWAYEPDFNGSLETDNITYYFCWKLEPHETFDMIHHILIGVFYYLLMAVFLFSYISILMFVRRNFRHFPGERPTAGASSAAAAVSTRSNSMSEITSSRAMLSPGMSSSSGKLPGKRHKKTAHLLMGLIATFFLCRTPLFIWSVLIYVTYIQTPSTPTNMVIAFSLQLLSSLKSAINPFIYTIWNDALRSSNPQSARNGGAAGRRSRFCWCRDSCGEAIMECNFGSILHCWRECRGKEPTSYDFTQNNGHHHHQQGGRVAPTSSAVTIPKVYTTSNKIETANKSTSLWPPNGLHSLDSVT